MYVHPVILIFISVLNIVKSATLDVHYLEPDSVAIYNGKEQTNRFMTQTLNIYCYRECDHDEYTQYEGGTPEMVRSHHEDEKSIFSFNLLSNNKKKLIKLDPFNQTCIGIASNSAYKVRLNLIRIDFWKVILLMIGLFVFLTSAKLSNNSLFYYLCGIFCGIFASFLVVVYMTSKIFPKKPMMYGVMVGGWTLGIYFAQMLLDNIRIIFVTYQTYVFWYVLITGFVSFIICYRLGPPKNQRSKDLIKWSLQFAALICIFFSSSFQEASIGICIATVVAYYFPRRWLVKTRSYWIRRFPPKKRLLTNEEFYEEGVRETTKALAELRTYCSSPECKQWSTVLKLKDPSRFASFMEGSSHIIDDEILEYETSNADIDLSEDESEAEEIIIDEDDEDESVEPQNGHLAYNKFAQRTQNGRNLNSTSTPTTRNNASRFASSSVKRNVRETVEFSEEDED